MRYAHVLGNGTPQWFIMIDLQGVRNTTGVLVTEISTYSGRDRLLGADKLAASWSQRAFELILDVQKLERNVNILQYLDMKLLHLPHRRLKADEVLTLADDEGLQMHNDWVVTAFDVRTGRNQSTNIPTARPLGRTLVLSTDCSCWRTHLFQTAHLYRPVFEFQTFVNPFCIPFDKDVCSQDDIQ